MNSLKQAIESAFASQGNQQDVSKVHALILKTNFILPIQKNSTTENPKALYYIENSKCFVPVFDEFELFVNWAKESIDNMSSIEIPGMELINGLSDETYLCLNLGSQFYKEFAPDEIARLKTIIAKLFKI